MNIELLDEKRVLIDLCLEDMQLLSIEYNTLNSRSPYSRRIINSLISIAKIKTGFCSNKNSSIYVEAMPYEGGCFILITLSNAPHKRRRFRVLKKSFKRIFSFNSCEDMLCAIEKLHTINYKSYSSTLIAYQNCYYLLLSSTRPIKAAVMLTINEYAGTRCTNKLVVSHILEHGTILVSKNAVEKIGVALCS